MTKIVWLHISDFHIRAAGDKFAQEQVVRSLASSIEVERTRLGSPHFAVLTGDVAFSGAEDEYTEASALLRTVIDAAGLHPKACYFVPGNHDVRRARQRLAYLGARVEIDSPQKVDEYFAQRDEIAPLLERQREFWAFVDAFASGQQRNLTNDGLAYVATLDIPPVVMCLLGLNSAWLSGDAGDERRLVIGERQVIEALQLAQEAKPHFTIAMAHHPLDLLAEWDSASCYRRLLPRVHFLLRGHLHEHRVSLTSTPSAPCIEIAAGSGYASSRFYENSYNFAVLDLEAGTCSVHHFTYRPRDARFERVSVESALVSIDGSLPGTQSDLADAIRATVPHASRFAGFMARLLTRQLEEVPIAVEGRVEFVTHSAMPNLVDEAQLIPTRRFIGLRNLLRLHPSDVALQDRVIHNAEIVAAYAHELARLVEVDSSCGARLQIEAPRNGSTDSSQTETWSQSHLLDLIREGDWETAERRARQLKGSPQPQTQRVAARALVQALMRSDESVKRTEAREIAAELVAQSGVDEDVILAVASAEADGDDAAAVAMAGERLRSGSHDEGFVAFARDLARRTGDTSLRELTERNSRG